MINNFLRGIIVALVGVLLITLNESAMPLMVRLVGAAFFVPAMVSLLRTYMSVGRVSMSAVNMTLVANMGSLVFGFLLLLFPVAFINIFVLLLAVVLLCFSLLQIYMILSQQLQKFGWGLLVMPVLLAVVSLIMLFNPFGTVAAATMIVGISMVVSGLSDIVISLLVQKHSQE